MEALKKRFSPTSSTSTSPQPLPDDPCSDHDLHKTAPEFQRKLHELSLDFKMCFDVVRVVAPRVGAKLQTAATEVIEDPKGAIERTKVVLGKKVETSHGSKSLGTVLVYIGLMYAAIAQPRWAVRAAEVYRTRVPGVLRTAGFVWAAKRAAGASPSRPASSSASPSASRRKTAISPTMHGLVESATGSTSSSIEQNSVNPFYHAEFLGKQEGPLFKYGYEAGDNLWTQFNGYELGVMNTKEGLQCDADGRTFLIAEIY